MIMERILKTILEWRSRIKLWNAAEERKGETERDWLLADLGLTAL